MPCGSFKLLSPRVLHAQRLDRALQRMLRFYRVVLRQSDVRLVVTGNVAELSLFKSAPPQSSMSYAIFFASLLGLARWLVDRPIAITSAEFRSTDWGERRPSPGAARTFALITRARWFALTRHCSMRRSADPRNS